MTSKLNLNLICFSVLHSALCLSLHAQGTAFTYQGRLNDGGSPAAGIYDLRFTIYDSTNLPGTIIAGPLTNSATGVSNGLFTATLDFGNVFPGANRFLEIAARTNGAGGFTTLSPRQQFTATPYAIAAGNLTGTLPASQVGGTISLAQLPATVVTNGSTSVNISGTFSGNGIGLTNADVARLTGHAIDWSAHFIISSSTSTGVNPESLAAADVNGDGRMDIISGNGDDTVSVLTNNGSGFVPASTLSFGFEPRSVAAADVNGDGRPDLICAFIANNTLSVFTNTGVGGTFAFASSLSVGSAPIWVTAADVNGDARMDLISANAGPNTLSVLTNNGSGSFTLSSSPSVGSSPQSVLATDVNGDGRIDLISGNFSASTLSILTNNAAGAFALASSPAVGANPQQVVAADVNGDGKPDLISVNSGNNTLSVLTNAGGGSFVLSSSPVVGAFPHAVAAVEINGDGKIDLISANTFGNSLSVLTNRGDGFFGLAATPGAGAQPFALAVADVDGNGRPELICADYAGNMLSVLFNVPLFSGSFVGNGAGLTSLAADAITTGTLADARLSANVARLDANQIFTGANQFNNAVGITGPLAVTNTVFAGGITLHNGGTPAAYDIRDASGERVALAFADGPGAYSADADTGDIILRALSSKLLLQCGSLGSGLTLATNNNVGIGTAGPTNKLQVVGNGTFTGSLFFGAQNRQMLNLWNDTFSNFGIGVQSNRLYFRTSPGSGFAWFQGGTHSSTTDNPGSGGAEIMRLDAFGNLQTTSGTISSLSDRNAKQHFEPVNSRDVLEKVAALPLSRWSYKKNPDARHLGPMAQDFYAAFEIGLDDKSICTVDADGVALAAIQGLDQKVKTLEAENADLKQRLDALEKMVRDSK